jgi:phospholipase/carboxylesterase
MPALSLHTHRWEPATVERAPVLLLLHGTGGDENDLIPLARMIAPGAALLSVRGNVLEQGAPRFFRRLAEGVFDLVDLERRTADLARFLRAAAEEYGFSSEALLAVGFSNGANIAASLLLTDASALRGGILLRAMIPFEPVILPDLRQKSVLLSQGRSDPLIPAEKAERLATLLESGGAEVELAWQPGGHQLTTADVKVAQRWLARLG